MLFPIKNTPCYSCDSPIFCIFCHIRGTSVAVSAFKSFHRQVPPGQIFFLHNTFGKLITNISLVSLITSTPQKHCHCPFLLTSYSFDLHGFGRVGTAFWEGSHDKVATVSSPCFSFFPYEPNITDLIIDSPEKQTNKQHPNFHFTSFCFCSGADGVILWKIYLFMSSVIVMFYWSISTYIKFCSSYVSSVDIAVFLLWDHWDRYCLCLCTCAATSTEDTDFDWSFWVEWYTVMVLTPILPWLLHIHT